MSDVSLSSKHPLEPVPLVLRFGPAPASLTDDVPRQAASLILRCSRLFWNIPVRQLAVRGPVEWERVRAVATQAALSWTRVAVSLTDADTGRSVLSLSKNASFVERLLALSGGDSVDILSSSSSSTLAVLYVVRGANEARKWQFLQVNGVAAEADWTLTLVARLLSSPLAGPVKMGSPRAQARFVLQLSCAPAFVELAQGELWNVALFADTEAVASAIQELAMGPQQARGPKGKSMRSPLPEMIRSPSSSQSRVLAGSPSMIAATQVAVRGERQSSSRKAAASVSEVLASWTSPCFKFNDQLTLPVGASPRVVEEVRLHRDDLRRRVHVIGQVENKLILTLLSDKLLVAFDQHAVHERILLEALLKEHQMNFRPTMRAVRSAGLQADRNMLARFSKALLPWFRVEDGVLVECAVVCDEMLTMRDMQEHLEELHSGLAADALPKSVHRRLCFKACRSAVKFGDPVTKAEAQELIAQLAACDFPFICAHGRQSCAVLHKME